MMHDLSGLLSAQALMADYQPSASTTHDKLAQKYSDGAPDIDPCFQGLPRGVGRYDALLLVKKVGKSAGFSARMVELLDYYMAYTSDVDWEQGADIGPVIYQSLSRTALDLNMSERHVQRLEKQLHDIGALDWRASGNYKRYGQRCAKTGRILYAYGADLGPLAALYPKLKTMLEEKKARDAAWMTCKRQISFYRRRCKDMLGDLQMLAEAEEGAEIYGSHASIYKKLSGVYDTIALKRIRAGLALARLEELHRTHKMLHDMLIMHFDTTFKKKSDENQSVDKNAANSFDGEESGRDVKNVVHNKVTTQEKTDKSKLQNNVKGRGKKRKPQGLVTDPKQACGLGEISLRDVVRQMTPAMHDLQPVDGVQNWADFIDVSYRRKQDLFISAKSWQMACGLLGRNGAAICVLLTDRASRRKTDPVRKPGHYFNALLGKAKTGALHLDASLLQVKG